MKYIKIFEEFSRGEFTKLSVKQLGIAKDYIKEVHSYINVDVNLHDIEVSSGIFSYKDEYYNNLEEVIDAKIPHVFALYGISHYTINNKLVDINGQVGLARKALTKLPFNFGKIDGNFYCDGNALTSLEGSPYYTNGSFYCCYNKLTSLVGGPEEVVGDFNCTNNKLTSLIGGPKKVHRHYHCDDNELITLEGYPEYVTYNITCKENPNLNTEGLPKYILDKLTIK